MEPSFFDAHDISKLPEHDLTTIAENQPPYQPLPVARLVGKKGRVVSRWILTSEERQRIVNGDDIYLEMLTFGRPLQPVLLTVGLRDIATDA